MNRRNFLRHGKIGAAATLASACSVAKGPLTRDIVDLDQADAVNQVRLIADGQVSAAEVLEAAITRAQERNPSINAIVTESFELARARVNDLPQGPITGLPYLIKDLSSAKDVRTTFGSRYYMDNVSTFSSPIVESVENAGGNVFGKTNTPEFGLIGTTESLALGPCRNPWNLNHSSGGSSGGAAAAVAAGIVAVAQASDGGGSIRIPASCCGLVGLKPSRGRMNGEQTDTMRSQISVRHAVSRSVRDNALLLAVGEASKPVAGLSKVGFITEAIDRPLRIAWSTQSAKNVRPDPDVEASIRQTALLCQSLGHTVVEDTPKYDGQAFEDAFLDLWSLSTLELRKQLLAAGISEDGFSDVIEPWTIYLQEHALGLGADGYSAAMRVFERVARRVDSFMSDYDVYLSPVLASAPPRIGEQSPGVAVAKLKERTFDYVTYTPVANVLGTPSISLPLHWNAAGLPIGSMFTAKVNDDGLLLQLAYQLEQAQPWRSRVPDMLKHVQG